MPKLQINSYHRSWHIFLTIAFPFICFSTSLKHEDLMKLGDFSYLMSMKPDQAPSSQ